jgi:hypothetical protein
MPKVSARRKSSVASRVSDAAAPPAELARAAAAIGAMSAGPAPVGPANVTPFGGAVAAALEGPNLEAGPAPARAGQREAAVGKKARSRPKRK